MRCGSDQLEMAIQKNDNFLKGGVFSLDPGLLMGDPNYPTPITPITKVINLDKFAGFRNNISFRAIDSGPN